MSAESQIELLANYIMAEVDGEPSQSEGAGDCAIRLLKQYKAWIHDLQSGMYVNCVYCGHRYGPSETTPVSMADALKAHIEQCPEHPASKLKAQNELLQGLWDLACKEYLSDSEVDMIVARIE